MITLNDLYQAQQRLTGIATRTPLIRYHAAQVWLKPEYLQPIGSFKIRGAFNRVAAIMEQEKPDGVIAYSSGNHAQGVAYAARHLNLPATIVMPTTAPQVKIEATRAMGAEVVLYDPAKEKREEIAQRLMQGKKWVLVPPFDDPYVIAGQGTIGLEILADFPEVEQVIVPVGGGGLISGIATAIKSQKPSVRVIGVEPEFAADAKESFQQGKVIGWSAAQVGRTIADGVRTLQISELTFAHIQKYVDDIITVTEDEIRQATAKLITEAKQVVEPAGALPVAAWLFHRDQLLDSKNTVCVISGGNIDPGLIAKIVDKGTP